MAGPARPLTAAHAERLHPQAHQFYRPLPPGPVKPFALWRWLGAGAGRDLAVVVAVGLLVGLIGLLIPMVTGVVFDRIVPGAERTLLAQIVLVLFAVYLGASLFDVARGFALVRVQTRLDTGAGGRGLGSVAAPAAAVLPAVLGGRSRGARRRHRRHPRGARRRHAVVDPGRDLLGLEPRSFSSRWTRGWRSRPRRWSRARRWSPASPAPTICGGAGELTALDGRLGGLLLQLVNGIAKLRVARAERRAFAVWANLVARRRSAELGAQRIAARVGVFNAFYPILCTGVLFYLLAGRDGKGPLPAAAAAMTTGQFLAFYAAFTVLLRSALDLLAAVLGVVAVIPLYERAKPILSEPPEAEGAAGRTHRASRTDRAGARVASATSPTGR